MSDAEAQSDRQPVRLTCPKCGKDMLEDAASTEIFHCLGCEGVWLRKGQLEQFLRDNASARGFVLEAVGMMESPPKSTSIKCPDCRVRCLEAVRYRGVEIDRCVSCRGVYADADERERIAERVLKARSGWESALREWEKVAATQRNAPARSREDNDEAGLLGMAIVNVIMKIR